LPFAAGRSASLARASARLRVALPALIDDHRKGRGPQTMERKMTQHCELSQIGPIGKVKEVGQNLMMSVASDASHKKDGEWVNRANWIEHSVFGRR